MFTVARLTQRGEVFKLVCCFVVTAKHAIGDFMMDFQHIPQFSLMLAALLAGVFVALAGGTSLRFPVIAAKELRATNPSRIIFTDKPSASALLIAKVMLSRSVLSTLNPYGFTAIVTGNLAARFLRFDIASHRTKSFIVFDLPLGYLHSLFASSARDFDFLNPVLMFFSVSNVRRLFRGVFGLPSIDARLRAELSASYLHFTLWSNEFTPTLLTSSLHAIERMMALLTTKLRPSFFELIRFSVKLNAAILAWRKNLVEPRIIGAAIVLGEIPTKAIHTTKMMLSFVDLKLSFTKLLATGFTRKNWHFMSLNRCIPFSVQCRCLGDMG